MARKLDWRLVLQGLAKISPLVAMEGFVDAVSAGVVHGWAWDPDAPGDHVDIDISHAGIILATVTADKFRPDLVHIEIGDGRHAFECTLPEALRDVRPAEVEIFYAGTNVPLPRVSEETRHLVMEPTTPRSDNEIIRALEARIASQEHFISDVTTMLNGLVDHVRRDQSRAMTAITDEDPETQDEKMATLQETLEEQSKSLASLEGFVMTFSQTMRELVDRDPEQEATLPTKTNWRKPTLNMLFGATLVGITVIFSAYFIFTS